MTSEDKGSESRAPSEMRSIKDEDLGSESGDVESNNISNRRGSSEHEPREFACSGAARFARKELDYIAEMYVANYDVFHKSSLGGGRAKEAIAMKRKLLQEMADHLTALVDEKRTVMQIDQKIRDEIRQVKKYFRHKKQDISGNGGYSREIRLSSSQQYIADNLKMRPRLSGIFDTEDMRTTEGSSLNGMLPTSNDHFSFDYPPGCSATECECFSLQPRGKCRHGIRVHDVHLANLLILLLRCRIYIYWSFHVCA
ncbi:hypothetical protein OESDEN_12966 [Oesophagostomum dentatum]|uniref:Uncharacterized protein n=1 Tax=Oesophagostomum dentatum TaxID=61180 RepID=A0A0B1SPL8_OESDE|nr:hypothetical protein OESDEN_12966 [Oesophagostomum dentatum]